MTGRDSCRKSTSYLTRCIRKSRAGGFVSDRSLHSAPNTDYRELYAPRTGETVYALENPEGMVGTISPGSDRIVVQSRDQRPDVFDFVGIVCSFVSVLRSLSFYVFADQEVRNVAAVSLIFVCSVLFDQARHANHQTAFRCVMGNFRPFAETVRVREQNDLSVASETFESVRVEVRFSAASKPYKSGKLTGANRTDYRRLFGFDNCNRPARILRQKVFSKKALLQLKSVGQKSGLLQDRMNPIRRSILSPFARFAIINDQLAGSDPALAVYLPKDRFTVPTRSDRIFTDG